MNTYGLVAFIPARSGSKRIPNKNIRDFNGKPLLAWSIKAAIASGLFDKGSVVVSSDDPVTLKIAEDNGATGLLCPLDVAHKDLDADIEWVRHALMHVDCDAFMILRPTSPFRTENAIRIAHRVFLDSQPCDSIRAIEPCKQHPFKMWEIWEDQDTHRQEIRPLMQSFNWRGETFRLDKHYHSMPYQSLPSVYVQNASLEVAWRKTVEETNTISGSKVCPFYTSGYEGFDINNQDDWDMAEMLIEKGRVKL